MYCADSWEGLPAPGGDIDDAVAHDALKSIDQFTVSLESVKDTFARYGLLDDQVVFLKGWFAETLPSAAFEKLAVARLMVTTTSRPVMPLNLCILNCRPVDG